MERSTTITIFMGGGIIDQTTISNIPSRGQAACPRLGKITWSVRLTIGEHAQRR